jgi:hypothetical protein
MGCSLRKLHVPAAPATDSHHVIPQAWQHFYVPRPELAAANGPVWDTRTVEVCPNCHRRVHEEIVALMRAGRTDDPLEAKLRAFGNRRMSRERTVALQALTRFAEAGGSLMALRSHRLFGAQ